MGLEGNPKRRMVLGGIGAAIAGVGAAALGLKYVEHQERRLNSPKKSESPGVPNELDEIAKYTFIDTIASPQRYIAGVFTGKPVNELFAYYTGYGGDKNKVGEYIDVDFKYQLGLLWQRKLGIENKGKLGAAEIAEKRLSAWHKNREMFDVAEHMYTTYYPNTPKSNVALYKNTIDAVITPIRRKLETALSQSGASKLSLTAEQASFAREAQKRIDGKVLIAYSLTELMPSTDGALNRHMFDFLLKNAGAAFIERIPAIHDDYISFGPYQLTEAAYGGLGSHYAAKQVGELLDRNLLPEDLTNLTGAQQHQTAYLFAVGNLMHLAKELKPQEVGEARRLFADTRSVVAFVAASHNKPREGLHAVKTCIEARIAHDKQLHKIDAEIRIAPQHELSRLHAAHARLLSNPPDLVASIAGSASRLYAQKTLDNLAALSGAVY